MKHGTIFTVYQARLKVSSDSSRFSLKKKSVKPAGYQAMQKYYRTEAKLKQLTQKYKLQRCSVYTSERRFLLYEI